MDEREMGGRVSKRIAGSVVPSLMALKEHRVVSRFASGRDLRITSWLSVSGNHRVTKENLISIHDVHSCA